MPRATVGELEFEYETFGDPADPAVLLVAGLGGQLTGWDERACQLAAASGYFVIRFDNRDVGLSDQAADSKVNIHAIREARADGEPFETPYDLTHMAEDAVGILDHLGIERTHVVGVSMGGMIAQVMAIRHPERLITLTSIMSTTGDDSVGQPTPEADATLTASPASTKDDAIESKVATRKVIGTADHFDETEAREVAAAEHDRSFDPAGVGRQLAAIMASPDRTEALRSVAAPTLVIHGTEDPLIDVSGGRATAEAIPGATLVEVDGMAHDIPLAYWPQVLGALFEHLKLHGEDDEGPPA